MDLRDTHNNPLEKYKDDVFDMIGGAILNQATDIKIVKEGKVLSVFFKSNTGLLKQEKYSSRDATYFISTIQRMFNIPIGRNDNLYDRSLNYKSGIYLRLAQAPLIKNSVLLTIRILTNENTKKFELENEKYIKAMLEAITNNRTSGGLVLVSGSTGTRKSTAIAATLNSCSLTGKNIVSIEDPIEYKLENVTQHLATEKLTFQNAIRAFLRHNPDIIYIGEIRDAETAKSAIEASRTGHLVISTIHASTLQEIEERFSDDFMIRNNDFKKNIIFKSNHKFTENLFEVAYE